MWRHKASTAEDTAAMGLLTILKKLDILKEYIIYDSGLDNYDYLELHTKENNNGSTI